MLCKGTTLSCPYSELEILILYSLPVSRLPISAVLCALECFVTQNYISLRKAT